MAKTNVLPMKVKRFIVTALAQGCGVAEVANLVKTEFGIAVSYAQLVRYNPLKLSGSSLSAPLRKLFMRVRAKAIEAADETDMSHKAIRLRKLDFLMGYAEANNEWKMQQQLLDLARKEMQEFILMPLDDGDK